MMKSDRGDHLTAPTPYPYYSNYHHDHYHDYPQQTPIRCTHQSSGTKRNENQMASDDSLIFSTPFDLRSDCSCITFGPIILLRVLHRVWPPGSLSIAIVYKVKQSEEIEISWPGKAPRFFPEDRHTRHTLAGSCSWRDGDSGEGSYGRRSTMVRGYGYGGSRSPSLDSFGVAFLTLSLIGRIHWDHFSVFSPHFLCLSRSLSRFLSYTDEIGGSSCWAEVPLAGIGYAPPVNKASLCRCTIHGVCTISS